MLHYAFCLLLLLLGTFAKCDKRAAPTPNYLQAQVDVNDAIDILNDEIVSMDNSIPLLNDTRRHYAEIVHAIFTLGVAQSGCLRLPYKQYYQVDINKYVPEAIEHPQIVIDEVRKHIEDFTNATKVIEGLIRQLCFPVGYGSQYSSTHRCDGKVQKHIDSENFPKKQVSVFLAAAKAASSFLAKHEEFLGAAKSYNTKAYIIHGENKLKQVVMDYADYLRASKANELGFYPC